MNQARSTAAYVASFVGLAVLLGVCMGTWSLTRPATTVVASPSVPFVGPTSFPSLTPSSAPTPTPDLDALRTTPLGQIPDEARFIAIGDAGDERVLMLDAAGGRVAEAAHFTGLGAAGADRRLEVTSSSDGSLVAILNIWDTTNIRLLLLRPATGELRAMSIPHSEGPRLSSDGRTLVVTRSRDPAQRGIWLIDLADGRGTRLVEDPAGRTTSRPIQWSRDGRSLAIVRDANGTDPDIALVDPVSRGVRTVAPGRNARWRGDELYVWSEKPGAGVTIFNATTGATRAAFAVDPDTVIDVLEVRPGSSDLAVSEHPRNAVRQVLLHAATTTVIAKDAQFLLAMWWSRDGAHLYGWTTFNGTETISDLLDGSVRFQFCRRVKLLPPCN